MPSDREAQPFESRGHVRDEAENAIHAAMLAVDIGSKAPDPVDGVAVVQLPFGCELFALVGSEPTEHQPLRVGCVQNIAVALLQFAVNPKLDRCPSMDVNVARTT